MVSEEEKVRSKDKLGQAGLSWAKHSSVFICVNDQTMKKKKEQKLSGEKSERGKFSVQSWQSDPMNSPKAFGELITDHRDH